MNDRRYRFRSSSANSPPLRRRRDDGEDSRKHTRHGEGEREREAGDNIEAVVVVGNGQESVKQAS